MKGRPICFVCKKKEGHIMASISGIPEDVEIKDVVNFGMKAICGECYQKLRLENVLNKRETIIET